MVYCDNRLDPKLDLLGTLEHQQNLDVADEALLYGGIVRSGNGAIVSGSTISGLSNITTISEDNYIQLRGINSGLYKINSVISDSVITVEEVLINDSSVYWAERFPYSIQDDINYARSDRANIKGVDYNDPVPTYVRPGNTLENINTNLSNISGKTTDAKVLIIDKKIENITPIVDGYYLTISGIGLYKHSDYINRIGIPIEDGYDVGNYEATYAEIIADGYQQGITVLRGSNAGDRIFGRMRAGTSISPNSVEVEFRSVGIDQNISDSIPYSWEYGQVEKIDIYYPYRDCLSDIDESAFRKMLVNGIIAKSGLNKGASLPTAQNIGQILFSVNGSSFVQALPITSTSGWLVNEGGFLLVAAD
jgi:hypothetical protein